MCLQKRARVSPKLGLGQPVFHHPFGIPTPKEIKHEVAKKKNAMAPQKTTQKPRVLDVPLRAEGGAEALDAPGQLPLAAALRLPRIHGAGDRRSAAIHGEGRGSGRAS